MKVVFTFLFISFGMVSYGQTAKETKKIRSTNNAEDRKFFLSQIHEIFSIRDNPKDSLFTDANVKKLTEEIRVRLNVKAMDYYSTLKDMDEGGYTLVVVLWNDLLQFFPQFKRVQCSANTKLGQDVSINYFFEPNGRFSFYSQLENRWKSYCPQ